MTSTALIGLDWGTSRLRAYAIDGAGQLIEARSLPHGIMALPEGGFAAALALACASWSRSAPIVAAGMVGARGGWREAPYLACPAALADLAGHLLPVAGADGRVVHIVPGLSLPSAAGPADVLRGEETQVLGAAGPGSPQGTFVLPGTHSKWIRLAGGRVDTFATFMTGEVYALLARHSILAASIEGDAEDPQAFAGGVGAGLAGRGAGGLLHQLFGVRALSLFDRLPVTSAASYLSGLLIGAELEGALGSGWTPGTDPVVVLGAPAMAERYLRAMSTAGVSAEAGPAEAAVQGLFRIAGAAGLV